jgi:hypothetical protein
VSEKVFWVLGGDKMWIVHEENHGALCVTHEIIYGIAWLVRNKWLDLDCETIDENDECHTLGEQIGVGAVKNDILPYFTKILCKDGSPTVIEMLEWYGFYFREIEEAF